MSDKIFYCPGCGLAGGDGTLVVESNCNASDYCWKQYQELTIYTLSLRDPDFIHQHVLDGYTAQHSSPQLTGIQICFALIGLYLFVEHDYSGRSVQQVHRQLAEKTKDWPVALHEQPIVGRTIADVLTLRTPKERVVAIYHWAETIWCAWELEGRQVIVTAKALGLKNLD